MKTSKGTNIKAVLLAAGTGTRLRPLTDKIPKCLLPIGGQSLLERWFEKLREAGVSQVLVNTHWLHEKVEAFIRESPQQGLTITLFYEPSLLGSAGTLLETHGWWEDSSAILILYADTLTTSRLSEIIKFHGEHDLPFTLGLFETDKPRSCGIAELDERDTVIRFVEKPKNPRSRLAAAGISVSDPLFLSRALKARKNGHRPYDLGYHLLPWLSGQMKGYRLRGHHIDIGTMASYRTAKRGFRFIS